ncbi:scavenger receptor class B member 1-like [Patiria miniata]|uniref:Scavenger receptor class B member 1 n=1 Tax=Patiria miniata TaxID=46514 RepID=A0A914BA15_PATMI|nr:scavenger receptor class B member 1-like [Patiria miniata]XP_038072677.1 scavenger receptor class B member 1-like [Patiria miniata]XP_038072679.1 scavenger receptor class B member 1-like [Patiria miniata]XP_038072680.1 scavenger receptor class B member 1-like [Patiria miniata]
MTGYKGQLVCVVTGTLLVITGAVLIPVVWNAVKHSLMTKIMVLEPSSMIYSIWEEPPFIIYWRFYFFDVENAEEVVKGAKPSVVQRGPYVYRLEMERQNLTVNSNSTISNKPVYSYFFEPDMSVGLESDSFTAVNVPYATATHLLDWLPYDIKIALSLVLDEMHEHLFKELTVKELLWGYEDEVLKILSKFIKIPGMPNGEFGFLVDQNGSAHDDFTVFSGKDVRSRINLIERWNGNNKLSWWLTPEANMINGTDGVMFHSFVTEKDTLYLFQPNLCRSMPYVFDRAKTIRGVPVSSFYLPPNVYQNGSVYPPNAGFCDVKTEDCGPTGQMRVDKCRFGVPTSISNPHFLYGDRSLIDGVNGLAPDPNEHKNYLSVQPILGVTFELKFRLQLNLYLEKVAGFSDIEKIIPVYFPMLWFEQSFEANDWMVNTYNSKVGVPTLVCQIAEYALMGLGVAIMLLSLVVIVRKYRRKRSDETEPLLSDANPSTNYTAEEDTSNHSTNYMPEGEDAEILPTNHQELAPVI